MMEFSLSQGRSLTSGRSAIQCDLDAQGQRTGDHIVPSDAGVCHWGKDWNAPWHPLFAGALRPFWACRLTRYTMQALFRMGLKDRQLLRSIGWNAKPLHTVPGGSGTGLWWAIQAADDPPSTVMRCDQGEILVTGPLQRPDRTTASDAIVATKATLRTLANAAPAKQPVQDPLQRNDPWGKWLEQNGRTRKVPAQSSNLSGEPAKPAVPAPAALTSGDLSKLTAHIEHQVLTKVQQQVDSATCTLGQKVNNIESQLGVMQRKVDSQESVLQQMFAQQMSKIEDLLAPKRPRKGDDGLE